MIAPEYPGYSIYQSKDKDADQVLNDSERVYEFLVKEMLIPRERIIIVGRSIGSGPAIHLASKVKVGSLIVISPFLSLKNATRDLLGFFGHVAKHFVKDRFQNIDKIGQVRSPVLLIHGRQDDIVPISHSQTLFGILNSCQSLAKYMPSSFPLMR